MAGYVPVAGAYAYAEPDHQTAETVGQNMPIPRKISHDTVKRSNPFLPLTHHGRLDQFSCLVGLFISRSESGGPWANVHRLHAGTGL
ncbi:hypothetical protein [Dyadobacter sp.]|uniref:hypothetical protein n=1 Tax=Dyadobacter sp. TaxID=1914288 RepID=UPI003267C2C8